MEKPVDVYKTIDEYISMFEPDVRETLETLRKTIKDSAPEAEETISYQMPAFKLHGVLVYFAAHKNHIGFYPTASGIETFRDRFSDYKFSKGAVQFPIDKPLPLELVSEIVRFKVAENMKNARSKSKKSK